MLNYKEKRLQNMYQNNISLFEYKQRLSSVVESQLFKRVKQCVRPEKLSIL
jgi:hypothetical protein